MKRNTIIIASILVVIAIIVAIICLAPKSSDSVSSNSINQIIELDINNSNVNGNSNVSDNAVVDSDDEELVESSVITIDETTGEIKEESIMLDPSETPIIGVTGGSSTTDNQVTTQDDETDSDNSSDAGASETTDSDDTVDLEVYINEDGELVLPRIPLD